MEECDAQIQGTKDRSVQTREKAAPYQDKIQELNSQARLASREIEELEVAFGSALLKNNSLTCLDSKDNNKQPYTKVQ
jgi:hypothetical protein